MTYNCLPRANRRVLEPKYDGLLRAPFVTHSMHPWSEHLNPQHDKQLSLFQSGHPVARLRFNDYQEMYIELLRWEPPDRNSLANSRVSLADQLHDKWKNRAFAFDHTTELCAHGEGARSSLSLSYFPGCPIFAIRHRFRSLFLC